MLKQFTAVTKGTLRRPFFFHEVKATPGELRHAALSWPVTMVGAGSRLEGFQPGNGRKIELSARSKAAAAFEAESARACV